MRCFRDLRDFDPSWLRTPWPDSSSNRTPASLRRAQCEIDLEPELYKHYLVDELPAQYKSLLDTRLCGIGERIVFEPYTREMYERTHRWMAAHRLFEDGKMGEANYEHAVI